LGYELEEREDERDRCLVPLDRQIRFLEGIEQKEECGDERIEVTDQLA